MGGGVQGSGRREDAGGPRIYRRADVERVLRIKHLLFVEGLTIAGARRKLQDEQGRSRRGVGGPGRPVTSDIEQPTVRRSLRELSAI